MTIKQRVFRYLVTGQTITADDWQLDLKPGDYYIIEQPVIYVGSKTIPMPNVYGEILEVEANGFCRVKAYSIFSPDGED